MDKFYSRACANNYKWVRFISTEVFLKLIKTSKTNLFVKRVCGRGAFVYWCTTYYKLPLGSNLLKCFNT